MFWIGCHSTILNSKTWINCYLTRRMLSKKILTRVKLKTRTEIIFFYLLCTCLHLNVVHHSNTSLLYLVYLKVYTSLHSEWINCYNIEVKRMLGKFMLISSGFFSSFLYVWLFFMSKMIRIFFALVLTKCIMLVRQFTL